ncbi:MAG: ABC transporter ATP-binding protein [Planctomycetes bacterium]|nr:ABC transporter ATP-binding protein [Planctomycetota bacterium]
MNAHSARSSPESGSAPLLEVRDLRKHFPVRRGIFSRIHAVARAVDGVDFAIGRGETLGLVGESGSGKTTVARTILRLEDPTSGQIIFDGLPLHALRGKALRRIRPRIQIIFQDPFASLNPRRMVSDIVGEALVVHGRCRRREKDARAGEILARVGLPATAIDRYPHEFSGGERQRISIARAIALEPDLLVCDEPVSALDVSIQAQVINLLVRLQDELHLAYLFIAHDLSVVRHISHRIAVMYLGRIVEHADRDALFRDPRHPYTRCLLASIPKPDPDARRQGTPLAGDIPSPLAPPPGCPFHPRCPEAKPICGEAEPPVHDHGGGHWSACHFRARA